MSSVPDLVSAATDDEEEGREYRRGYDDGFEGRGMKSRQPTYSEGYADGFEDREYENSYYSPVDDIDWCW